LTKSSVAALFLLPLQVDISKILNMADVQNTF